MDIEERVLRFVSEERGIKLPKLKLSDRLQVDLGIDGDDAIEFFEKFEAEFNLDCSDLEDRWDDYFGPEAVAWSPNTLAVSGVIGLLIAILFPRLRLGFLSFLGIGIILFFAWAQIHTVRERKNPSSPQITIAQLVEAVTTKCLVLTGRRNRGSLSLRE